MTPMGTLFRPSRVLLAALLAITCLLLGCRARGSAAPRAVNGVIDLHGWSFDTRGPLDLDGGWDVHWQRLLEPAELAHGGALPASTAVDVPGVFEALPQDGATPADRQFETLRLRVHGVEGGPQLALRIAGVASAYRLWANGKLVVVRGTVGATESSTVPFEMPCVVPVAAEAGDLDLVMQVANFHMADGGVYEPIALGPEVSLIRRQSLLEALDLGLLGALTVIGLYHVALFLIRRQERGALLIAAICICWAARIPFAGLSGRVWSPLAPLVSWRVGVVVSNVGYVLGIVPIMLMLAWAHPLRHTRIVAAVSSAIALCGSLLIASLPARLADTVGNAFVPFTGLLAGYGVLAALWYARTDRRPGALPMALGFLVLGGVGANDMLGAVGLVRTVNLTPIGVLVFVLLQATVVARRLYAAFASEKALTLQLEQTNRELEHKDRMKDDFLAVTSHELKTPLHGMIGIADSLMAGAGGALPSSARNDLSLIADSGRRLTGLVDDILDYSRLKHSDVRLVRTAIDVRAIAQTVLDVLGPLARRKGLALRNDVSPALPAIEADEARVYQILYNLVGNAIKYSPAGAIRVEAEIAGELVTVSVVDAGVGIAAEKLATVFDAYAQVDPSVGPAGGVGLGLAICRKLVELHGGVMSVVSEVGSGSRFSFGIPAAREAPARASSAAQLTSASGRRTVNDAPSLPATRSAEKPAAKGDRAVVRVLVVDDEPVNLHVVTNHLALEGWSVETASSGEEALAAVDGATPPDVVLLDVMMPGLNGFDVCRAIREKRSASALPIVLLTSLNRREDVMHGFEVGANDYLMKPFHADELVARVRSLVLVRQSFATMEENLRLARQVADGKMSEARAKLEVDRATIEMLRYQLNPHFLLNALAAIRGAITESPDTARLAVSDLSDFCRLTLRRAAVELVTIDEELEMIRAFLGVHKTRWGDYLQVSTSVEESILRSHIPAWLLQPIVENALKHGTRTSPDALEVRVAGRRLDATTLALTVSNTGRFVADADLSEGIGMENLRRRLARWYPGGHSLRVITEGGWVHIELTLSERTLAAKEEQLASSGERSAEVRA